MHIIILWNSLDINECPLGLAKEINSHEIVNFLVQHGAKIVN